MLPTSISVRVRSLILGVGRRRVHFWLLLSIGLLLILSLLLQLGVRIGLLNSVISFYDAIFLLFRKIVCLLFGCLNFFWRFFDDLVNVECWYALLIFLLGHSWGYDLAPLHDKTVNIGSFLNDKTVSNNTLASGRYQVPFVAPQDYFGLSYHSRAQKHLHVPHSDLVLYEWIRRPMETQPERLDADRFVPKVNLICKRCIRISARGKLVLTANFSQVVNPHQSCWLLLA